MVSAVSAKMTEIQAKADTSKWSNHRYLHQLIALPPLPVRYVWSVMFTS